MFNDLDEIERHYWQNTFVKLQNPTTGKVISVIKNSSSYHKLIEHGWILVSDKED